MFDLVKFLLRTNYFYGRILGVINFKIDLATGRATQSRSAVIYAGVLNVLVFLLVPLLVTTRLWTIFWVHSNSLHQYVFLTVLTLRVGCVMTTLLSRWWQRRRLLRLLASFRRLVLAQPQVMRLWQRGVICKCFCGVLTEVSHMVMAFNGVQRNLTVLTALGMILLYVLISLLNVILSQYYFFMLNVYGHYILINQKLSSILEETCALQLKQRQDVRILQSCALTDRLESLAHLQSKLQAALERLTRVFGLQNLCMGIIFYISLVSGIYYMFCIFKYHVISLDWTDWTTYMLIICIISYVLDMQVTYFISFNVQDVHEAIIQQLSQHTSFTQKLDVRLRMAFDTFQLQLLRNPFKLSILGLYNMQRSLVICMASSMITFSLIIIQYDIKNY